jgi:hypothetical protein
MAMTIVRTLLREPLLHFVLLGGALFLIFGGGEEGREPGEIVVSAGQVRNLAAVFERTWQRPPTEAELDGLIQDRIDEEVMAREARALGLDQDDTVIRRRLRQKMEFVAQDLARPEPPDGADLQAYLEAHPERFTRPGRLTYTQVFLDRSRRGERLDEDAGRLLARLNAGGPDVDARALGDPSLLEAAYADISTGDVARMFGADFAERLGTLPLGRWSGPVPSPYGTHLVRIEERTAPSLPPLDEVRDQVAREVEAERAADARDALIAGLRERYEIVVERPEPELALARDEEVQP